MSFATTPLSLRSPLVLCSATAVLWAGLLLTRFVPASESVLYWSLDLMASWGLTLTALLAIGWSVALRCNAALRSAAALAVVLGSWALASPSLPKGPAPQASSGPTSVAVAVANLHFSASDVRILHDWLLSHQPDVIVLLEVSPSVAANLAEWADWPHQSVAPDDSPFGIALLSKYPLASADIHEAEGQPPSIRAKVAFEEGAPLAMVAVHPMPPISPTYLVRRDQLLLEGATWLTSQGGGVLAGDFNATAWNRSLHVLAEAGLRRASSLLSASWPAMAPYLVGLQLDHVAATEEWCVVGSAHGPNWGSDHRPQLYRLAKC